MTDLPEGCKSFDRSELQKCANCGKGMAHDRHLVFYEISIGQVMLDQGVIQQITGLEMMMGGNATLAAAFAPTSAVAVRLPPTRLLLCNGCFSNPQMCRCLPILWEESS
jgi:hypothetical protein